MNPSPLLLVIYPDRFSFTWNGLGLRMFTLAEALACKRTYPRMEIVDTRQHVVDDTHLQDENETED